MDMALALVGAFLKPDERRWFRGPFAQGKYFFDGMVLNRNCPNHKCTVGRSAV
jgi:hypothetical protein